MEMLKDILKNHPTFKQEKLEKVESCIKECLTCFSVCKICADACLNEKNTSELTECIKKNLACADICSATASSLSYTVTTQGSLKKLVETCLDICKTCGDECEKHGKMMEHCKVCADCCRKTEKSCRELLEA